MTLKPSLEIDIFIIIHINKENNRCSNHFKSNQIKKIYNQIINQQINQMMTTTHENENLDHSTLFVGHLPFNNSTSFLQIKEQIINAFHPNQLLDVNVSDKKDKEGQIVIYAFIKFKSTEIAEKAFAKGSINVGGKNIKLQKFSPQCEYQIYIKDIANLLEEQLSKHFSTFGKIEDLHTYKSSEFTHPSGLLKYQNESDAENCLKQHEHIINDKKIRIEKYISKEERREEHNKLFVKKIPLKNNKAAIEQELTKQFQKFGELLKDIEVVQYRPNHKSPQVVLGNAIIIFKHQKSAENARLNFNLNLFGNEPMQVQLFVSKKDRKQKDSLFITNLTPSIDQAFASQIFSKYGKIQKISYYTTQFRENTKVLNAILTYQSKESFNELLIEHKSNQVLRSLFIDKTPKINIYQDKTQRSEFKKVVGNKKPKQLVQYQPIIGLPGSNGIQGMPTFPGMIPGNQGMPNMPGMNPQFQGNFFNGVMYAGFTGGSIPNFNTNVPVTNFMDINTLNRNKQ